MVTSISNGTQNITGTVTSTETVRRPNVFVNAAANNSTGTLTTVPANRTYTVMGYTLSGYCSGATANNMSLKLGADVVEIVRMAGAAATASPFTISKVFRYGRRRKIDNRPNNNGYK